MLDLVVATNNEDILSRNLLRSPLLRKPGVVLHRQEGYKSAAKAFNAALGQCRHEVAVLAHQDVYLPNGWDSQLMRSVELLNQEDPAWAVLGVYGVTWSGAHVGYVWSSGLQTVLGKPFDRPQAVASVDELLIVIRRSSGVKFDEALPGFHLYGTDIVQIATAAGRGAYVICAPAVHNSRPVLYLPNDYLDAYDFVADKWRHKLPIPNCVAPIRLSHSNRLKMRARQLLQKFRNRRRTRASLDRNLDSLEIAARLGFE